MEPIQILVIDPEQTTRDQLKAALELDGRIELHLSSSAEGAVETLVQRKRWALIILNAWLPGKGAFALIQECRQRDPRTQFILLSQDAGKAELVNALRLGVTDYFEKPLPIDELKAAVNTVVEKLQGLAQVISLPRNETRVHSPEIPRPSLPVGPHLRLVSSDSNPEISPENLEVESVSAAPLGPSYTHMKRKWIETFEVDYLAQLLNLHSGNVSAAAREARLDRSNFLRLLRKYGLKAEAYRAKMAA